MKHPVAERGSFGGFMGNGVPSTTVFDHKGRIVIRKRLFDKRVREAIFTALKAAPHPLLGEKEYVKLSKEAGKVKAGEDIGAVLAKVRAIWADENADPDLWDEAYTLFSRLDNYGEHMLSEALIAEEKSPVLGLQLFKEVAKIFKGDIVGEEAEEAAATIKKDKNFQNEKEAWAIWVEFEAIYKAHRFRISVKNRAMKKMTDLLCNRYQNTAGGKMAIKLMPDLIKALSRYASLTEKGDES